MSSLMSYRSLIISVLVLIWFYVGVILCATVCLLAIIGSVKVNMKLKLTLFTFSTYVPGLVVHSLSVHAMGKKKSL